MEEMPEAIKANRSEMLIFFAEQENEIQSKEINSNSKAHLNNHFTIP